MNFIPNISIAGVPPDGRPVEIVLKFHTPLTVTMYVLAVVGIVFATVCIAFMVVFRTEKVRLELICS